MKTPAAFLAVLMLSGCVSSDYHEPYATAPTASEVEAGAIRGNDDARAICPSVCGARGWAGTWRRIGDDHRAVCGCAAGPAAAPAEIVATTPSTAQPTACSVQGNDVCAGCAVSCPSGQQASCLEGVVQQGRTGPAVCETPARCMCH